MFSVRLSPNTIGSVVVARPGREHLGSSFRVDADVPLRGHIRVAAVLERAAHDHQSTQQARQCRLDPKRQRQIGHRPRHQPDQLTRVRVRRAHPRLGGVVRGDHAVAVRQLGVAESLRPVSVLGGAQRRAQRPLGALRHRDARCPAQFQQPEVVDAYLVRSDIAASRRDAHQLGFRAGRTGTPAPSRRRRRCRRRRIWVTQGHQCTPGTNRTARLMGRGTLNLRTARAGRLGWRRDCCDGESASGCATPRAAGESG